MRHLHNQTRSRARRGIGRVGHGSDGRTPAAARHGLSVAAVALVALMVGSSVTGCGDPVTSGTSPDADKPATTNAPTKAPPTEPAPKTAPTEVPPTEPATENAPTEAPTTEPATETAPTKAPTTETAPENAPTEAPTTETAPENAPTEAPTSESGDEAASSTDPDAVKPDPATEPVRLMITLTDPALRDELLAEFGADMELLRELRDGALLVALVAAHRLEDLADHRAVDQLLADEPDPPADS